jgi:hypothetical protein
MLALAALCLGPRIAHAQAAPVPYWTPGWPIGFGGNLTAGANTYGNFPSFDGSGARGGFSVARYGFSNGMFVGAEGGGLGLSMNGFSQGAFGSSLTYEGVQFGYNFQNSPVTVYAGFDTLKYNSGIGSPLAFDSTSTTVPGYRAHAGIEFQPSSNLSLSLGVGVTQQSGQSGRLDSDINSPLLPGATPFAFGGRR